MPTLQQKLRAFALSLPETEEGIACEGTALEKRTIKVRKKAFIFIGKSDVMFKLAGSLAEAAKVAKDSTDQIKVGSSGWTTVRFDERAAVPLATLKRWIEESYRLFAPKLVSQKAPTAMPARKSSSRSKLQ